MSKFFNPTAELEIPIKIPIKEAKGEIEMEPGTAEIKIANVWWNLTPCKMFASYSLNLPVLFFL